MLLLLVESTDIIWGKTCYQWWYPSCYFSYYGVDCPGLKIIHNVISLGRKGIYTSISVEYPGKQVEITYLYKGEISDMD